MLPFSLAPVRRSPEAEPLRAPLMVWQSSQLGPAAADAAASLLPSASARQQHSTPRQSQYSKLKMPSHRRRNWH
jgi:hypothetical protein